MGDPTPKKNYSGRFRAMYPPQVREQSLFLFFHCGSGLCVQFAALVRNAYPMALHGVKCHTFDYFILLKKKKRKYVENAGNDSTRGQKRQHQKGRGSPKKLED